LFLLFGIFFAAIPVAFAQPVYLELTQSGHKFGLGLSDFGTAPSNIPANLPDDLRTICKTDLEFSRLFNIHENGPSIKGEGEARKWAELGVDVAVTAQVIPLSKNQFELQAQVYDAATGRLVAGIPSAGFVNDPAPAAHHIADEIVRYFTGRSGVAHTRIAFSNDMTGSKELYVMDYDGRHLRELTSDQSIVLFPKFSPQGDRISFTSYLRDNPDLYVIGTDGSDRKRLSSRRGLNTSANWAPDGQHLSVTLSMDGAPNVYLIDLSGRVQGRLTREIGAATAASFSPDGTKIAFTSDAPGYPQIYMMNSDGTGLQRLTTGGHCDSPRFCPTAPLIAYVKGDAGPYDIYTMDVGTHQETRITQGDGSSESPSWSPDGNFILYVHRSGRKSELYVVGADGSNPHPLVSLKGRSFTPDWGP
jgi:TolB protein